MVKLIFDTTNTNLNSRAESSVAHPSRIKPSKDLYQTIHIPAKDNPAIESIEADLKFVYTQLEQKKTSLMEN